ncbi:Rrf2 family transcriptional regulator [Shinella sp. WSJ-2]|uniref:Rrf2 family transcriptional regulator n=1 Tax=Shinella sp. WSJ-2 TaxID=2303749 RepID=UPI000E3C8B91|nr:Rrf2 family transcriptional regulator [Shinella sp. WSJ-2]MBO9630815.1 Rrf2 family transcriptional regulator [Shinella sp.]RFZ86201.1 Rrf2 family transcriptional regulator [Shinella sp. WSJ-2]
MRLTLHTDYALRMLIYVAARADGLCTVSDVAAAYGLSRNHLLKVAQTLRDIGVVETTRGRTGGIRLAKAPEAIGIGALVRATEEAFSLAECMQAEGGSCCVISPACRLKGMLHEALAAFLAVLDRYTLADIVRNRAELGPLLGLGAVAA